MGPGREHARQREHADQTSTAEGLQHAGLDPEYQVRCTADRYSEGVQGDVADLVAEGIAWDEHPGAPRSRVQDVVAEHRKTGTSKYAPVHGEE